MESGKEAIEEQEYEEAQSFFEQAFKQQDKKQQLVNPVKGDFVYAVVAGDF